MGGAYQCASYVHSILNAVLLNFLRNVRRRVVSPGRLLLAGVALGFEVNQGVNHGLLRQLRYIAVACGYTFQVVKTKVTTSASAARLQ